MNEMRRPPPMRDAPMTGARRFRQGAEPWIVGGLAIAGILLLLFWRLVLVVIPPGHVGVLYSLLSGGTVTDRSLGEGLTVKWPWNRVYLFETRLQSLALDVNALSLEGMGVRVEATAVFRINPDAPGRLLREVGHDYVARIAQPLAVSAVRRVVALSDSHRLYTFDSATASAEVLRLLSSQVASEMIRFEEVVFRSIGIPDTVRQSIEQKLTQEQLAASYAFVLTRAQSEAERQRIEALGLQNYYTIVGSALSRDVLTWAGIQATSELARSTNSKVVVVGGGQGQMPLILGSDILSAAPAPPRSTEMRPEEAPLNLPPVRTELHDPTRTPLPGLILPGGSRAAPGTTPPPPPPATR
jgi:regulator of protease activity HflC (stomatin/prohibitin superfamily)